MDNRNNEYISEALKIADDLMELANDEAGLADESGFGILLGVMRDCAYKIRRHAEKEGRKAKVAWVSAKAIMVIFALGALSILLASPASATIILSTDAGEILGGLAFDKGDLAEYDAQTDTATLYFDENLFGGITDIDAAHVLANGNIIISTLLNATLGGLNFTPDDLIEYNPTTDVAKLFFDGDLFTSGTENIDAVHILDSGNIVLSPSSDAELGGLNFGYGDLVEYNPTTDVATMFFDGSLFDGSENIDAAYILDNGNIILSTEGAATLGGLTFANGDLAEYNPTTDVATLYFAESLFSTNANVDAVYVTTVPEPATIALLGLGCLVLVGRKRR
ncbi:MAG: PEP-CTERM sorting domain-containing protein [Sedimentisphaerales bacterium]